MTNRLILPALALLLAGCATNPLEVRRTSCPAVAVARHSGTLTRFDGAGYDLANVQFSASITNVEPFCVEDGKGVRTAVRFAISGSRRVTGPALDVQLPYFIALVKGGNVVLTKQVYGAALRFDDNALNGNASETVTVTSPPVELPERPKRKKPEDFDDFAPPPKPADYEVLIGFQLSDQEAVYNITK